MRRRFNYTNRVRLLHEDARFFLVQEGGKWSFDAELELGEYGLPPEALVSVEAYRQTTLMRFEWGTVGAAMPPADRTLADFDSPDDILFRVRVTSPGSPDEPHGLLLAEADRIRLRGPEDSERNLEPLLPVVPADLGDELWRVDFSEKPRLQINRDAGGDFRQIGKHPIFVSVVYPAAMREILTHILFILKLRDHTDEDDPHARWLRFAVQVLEVGEPPPEEDGPDVALEWVDDAVSAFATKHGLSETFRTFWAAEVTT